YSSSPCKIKFNCGLIYISLGLYTVNSAYGDTITMPCRLDVPQNLMFGKWKYVSLTYLGLEQPSKPEIVNKALFLETEQLKKVRLCFRLLPLLTLVLNPTEQVTIQVLPPKNAIKEGDNITLKCIGNGNPPPEEFLFYLPVTIRIGSLEANNNKMKTDDSKCLYFKQIFWFTDLDLSLNPSGEVTKQIGDALPVSCTISASRNATVVWMKDNIRLRSSPSFSSLHYQDAGNYVCETALQEVEGLKKSESLTLIVEGKPQIKMTKKTDPSGLSKTIICHVEGFPKPAIQWTITGSGSVINQTEESPYINGRYYSKIIISPEENVTLTCTAENQLERTVNSLNVSANENKEKVNDQAKLIVGIVVGLLLAALVAGVVYWLYIKKSKTASKHVNKDLGNMEENKKLEENNHKTEA
uniref:CD166 antigen n=1 Tax=Propithecus coquereli TaxID=379532 RepID=A0A2K6FIN7_PROCO